MVETTQCMGCSEHGQRKLSSIQILDSNKGAVQRRHNNMA